VRSGMSASFDPLQLESLAAATAESLERILLTRIYDPDAEEA
jgi:hypothetical protein